MKNNSLAMLATISLALGLASLIGYIDPAVCEGLKQGAFGSCEQSAQEHIWAFWGFAGFGILTLVGGTIRSRRMRARDIKSNLG
ncbi:MAG: hypothetical protein KGL72_07115 [Actinomycetales bacterium]|nr:hypothetical protein [Actinomycetales bacterium]